MADSTGPDENRLRRAGQVLASLALIFRQNIKALGRGALWHFRPPNKRRSAQEDKIVGSINEAAKNLGTQSLTFFVASTYIAFSAAGVRDEFFIFHDKLNLPIANVTIPVEWFFLVAPTLLTGLHLMILLHQYYLLEKLAALPWKRREIKTELFLPSISISGHFPREYLPLVGGVVFVLFWSAYIIAPLAVLVYLQMCALRFKIHSVEHAINACMTITLISSIVFVAAAGLIRRSNTDLWGEIATPSPDVNDAPRWLSKFYTWAGRLFALAFLVGFAHSYIKMLHQPEDCVAREKFLGIFSFRRHLNLTAMPKQSEDVVVGGRDFNFRGKDLRCADFSNVELAGVDFRGADLSGAAFTGANLREANFSSLGRRKTILSDASFARADLSRARLDGAILANASFRRASLQEATLVGADLSKARLVEANMIAADLTRSRLRGSIARKARLAFAKLDYASIELARFDQAWMDRVSFKGAATFGASFRGARLRGATGLRLAGVDLQSAWVWGLNSCNSLSEFPTHVNFRSLKFDPVEDWQSVLEEIRAAGKNPLSSSTWARMKMPLVAQAGNSDPTCISSADEIKVAQLRGWSIYLREKNILYDKPGPGIFLESLPTQPPLTEEEYLSSLTRELVKKACLEEFKSRRVDLKGSLLRELLELRAKDEVGRFGERLRQQLRSVSCETLAGTSP